ncbi:alkylhydroperoxidase family enzyme [Novosphingobium sp. PhB165]|uniref:carboxymuconolactone decarboxylase family protein n=1 Tax=Novosphingobium sp. PhB165 TaxID=2485105 RepID=UPI00104A07F2|nr:carboxymuconolactone decarboxylase family protein [Novosphingobium sp. PhB165]TCM18767.1 alkylhydroperoxidase family enzyme [Novosphingobium sp. PhB165]
MHQPDPAPRIPPLEPERFTEETDQFFNRWTGGFFKNADRNPVLMTFAHHPQLGDLFSQFNVHLLSTSTLPVKERQIAIMRTAWLCKARYMWSSHLNTSMLCGLSPEMFRPLQVGADDPYFTEFECSVIRATEDLVERHEVSPENWAALREEWDERQMLDFLFTVGAYVALAGVMRSTGVQRDDNLRALAAEYGAPD